MALNLTSLKTELQDDPTGLGYAALGGDDVAKNFSIGDNFSNTKNKSVIKSEGNRDWHETWWGFLIITVIAGIIIWLITKGNLIL